MEDWGAVMSVSKPEITEYSCIKAKELMVKWEFYHKQEMDKLRERLLREVNSAYEKGFNDNRGAN